MEAITYYIYDGSYYGMLTAIQWRFQIQSRNIIITPDQHKPNTLELFANYTQINTNKQLAKSLLKQIRSEISTRIENRIYYAFLSEQPGIEDFIFDYLSWGFEIGEQVEELLSKESVCKINNLSQKVSRERHKMLGLLRFQKLTSGIYYAPMEPDHDIITLIAPHFRKRLRDQSWIIHDKSREKYALYNQKQLIYTTSSISQNKLSKHEEEQKFQNLWKKYFCNITIPERRNLRLQKQFLPKKYWKYLTEKN